MVMVEVCRVGLLFSTQVENLHSIFTLGNDVETFPQKFAQMEINLDEWKLIFSCANPISTGWKQGNTGVQTPRRSVTPQLDLSSSI